MKIETGTQQPIKLKQYRTPIQKIDVIDKALDEMLDANVIRRSKSPWSFPVVIVDKKDGSKRFCIDFRKLNQITKPNYYPLPLIDDILTLLGKAKYFTSLDLKSGYWQVLMDEKDKEKTAFACHRGLFEFNVMPFGLTSAPAVFQEFMSLVLHGLSHFATAYLDDILIYSEKKVREKSRECHNHKPQPFPDPKRNRKPTNLNKHKPNKRTKSTKISSLFLERGNCNTKRTEKHKNKMTHGKTYNKLPGRINHKAPKSKNNIGTTALERSVEQTTGGFKALLQQANFTLGPDATLNTEIHKNSVRIKAPNSVNASKRKHKNQINHYNKQRRVLMANSTVCQSK